MSYLGATVGTGGLLEALGGGGGGLRFWVGGGPTGGGGITSSSSAGAGAGAASALRGGGGTFLVVFLVCVGGGTGASTSTFPTRSLGSSHTASITFRAPLVLGGLVSFWLTFGVSSCLPCDFVAFFLPAT